MYHHLDKAAADMKQEAWEAEQRLGNRAKAAYGHSGGAGIGPVTDVQSPLVRAATAMNEVADVRGRLERLVERMLGPQPEMSCQDRPVAPNPYSGIIGEIGVMAERTIDNTIRINDLLAQIERALP